jgi:hypothetical protein
VDRGRVGKLDGVADIPGGQPDPAAVVQVLDGERPIGVTAGDPPGVAVVHPAAAATEAAQAAAVPQEAVVAAGDDPVADAGEVAVVQLDARRGYVTSGDAFGGPGR